MRIRPAARLFVLSADNRVLLFRFQHTDDALTGRQYWATPGGGLEHNESFEEAALRELQEETGISRQSAGPQIASQRFTMMLPSGESVIADERFFMIRVVQKETEFSGWSHHEKLVIGDHRWWSLEELRQTEETVFPLELLVDFLLKQVSQRNPAVGNE
ncbi:NUDIX domain-containing protein [Escherichia coli]|uniref:NUDIX hydrolase n=1 Tax=Escherichia sp. MOD1-EC7003 TaxID=2093900 RepID=UPI000CF78F04|nr:NUDIX domain-containing protein [Escherichia sp. MOD1-EC7003]EGO8360040.1 NUDIX domain-containing protein [Escherichia coli]EGO8377447.1 NUDIX domain-containing protein [Escherichia coli]MCH0694644.1 NUDIX domain-containing protein [Escherichia coli]